MKSIFSILILMAVFGLVGWTTAFLKKRGDLIRADISFPELALNSLDGFTLQLPEPFRTKVQAEISNRFGRCSIAPVIWAKNSITTFPRPTDVKTRGLTPDLSKAVAIPFLTKTILEGSDDTAKIGKSDIVLVCQGPAANVNIFIAKQDSTLQVIGRTGKPPLVALESGRIFFGNLHKKNMLVHLQVGDGVIEIKGKNEAALAFAFLPANFSSNGNAKTLTVLGDFSDLHFTSGKLKSNESLTIATEINTEKTSLRIDNEEPIKDISYIQLLNTGKVIEKRN